MGGDLSIELQGGSYIISIIREHHAKGPAYFCLASVVMSINISQLLHSADAI